MWQSISKFQMEMLRLLFELVEILLDLFFCVLPDLVHVIEIPRRVQIQRPLFCRPINFGVMVDALQPTTLHLSLTTDTSLSLRHLLEEAENHG